MLMKTPTADDDGIIEGAASAWPREGQFFNGDGSKGIDGAECAWPRKPRVGSRNGLAWHLLQIKSGAEAKIAEFLERFGYEMYYPKTTVLKVVPRRQLTPSQRSAGSVVRRPYQVAIFPGYPYIRFDMEDRRCHELFEFAGVYGIHCAGDKPVTVDDAYVNYLKTLEDEPSIIPATVTLKALFAVGDVVRMTGAGPFRGFTAVVEKLPTKLQDQINSNTLAELDESMCATIAIQIFGQSSRVLAPIGHLQKIEP